MVLLYDEKIIFSYFISLFYSVSNIQYCSKYSKLKRSLGYIFNNPSVSCFEGVELFLKVDNSNLYFVPLYPHGNEMYNLKSDSLLFETKGITSFFTSSFAISKFFDFICFWVNLSGFS